MGTTVEASKPGAHLLLAHDEGLLRARLFDRARRGELTRVRPGVYIPTANWSALAPHERYRERVEAAARIFHGAVFCQESAASVLRLPVIGNPSTIHLFDPTRAASRRFGDVMVHASKDDRQMEMHHGILVTTMVPTVIDLSRRLRPAEALALVDAAVSIVGGRRTTVDVLRAHGSADAARRGSRQLEWLWDFADEHSESVGESVSRVAIRWLGFPKPELQHWFAAEGFRDRSDFWWPQFRAIGESDGYGKYSAHTAAEATNVLIREKKREDRLRRQSDGFARWDWADTWRVEPLRAKLLQAGVQQISPANRALLATLTSRRTR